MQRMRLRQVMWFFNWISAAPLHFMARKLAFDPAFGRQAHCIAPLFAQGQRRARHVLGQGRLRQAELSPVGCHWLVWHAGWCALDQLHLVHETLATSEQGLLLDSGGMELQRSWRSAQLTQTGQIHLDDFFAVDGVYQYRQVSLGVRWITACCSRVNGLPKLFKAWPECKSYHMRHPFIFQQGVDFHHEFCHAWMDRMGYRHGRGRGLQHRDIALAR
ncbi:MAG: hypothetical protein ACRYGK_04120 [Janthinobacterium lividum]